MAAVFGAGAVTGVIDSIFSRLVGAFQKVFQTALRFTKPKWVLLFAVGAPILFKLIDNAVTIAQQIVSDWSDTIMQTAYNVYSAILNYLCNSLGCTVSGSSCTCNIPIVGGIVSALISQLAMLLSGPIVIVALFLKYVVVPLASWILTMLKNVVSAVYAVVCTVLVPIVRIVIGALTAYYSVTRIRRNIYDSIVTLAEGRLIPTIATIALPLLSGLTASAMYDAILMGFGACTEKAVIVRPGTSRPPTTQSTNTKGATIASSETIVAYLTQQGTPQAIFNYSITANESLAATIYAYMMYKHYIDVRETIAALISYSVLSTLNVKAVEQIAAVIKLFKPEFEISVKETITAVLQGLIAIITALENYWPYVTINITALEKYRPYITINVTAQEKYMPAISAVITAQETYTSGQPILITAQEEYLMS